MNFSYFLLKSSFHFDAESLEFGESSLSTVLSVFSLAIGLLENSLELSDFSSQTSVLQIQLMELAIGTGKSGLQFSPELTIIDFQNILISQF